MNFLKNGSPTTIILGPFVSPSDGVTPVTDMTLSGADSADLFKHSSGTAVDISGRTFSHIAGSSGWYTLDLLAMDVNTHGRLTVTVSDTDKALPVWFRGFVAAASYFDTLLGGGGIAQLGAGAPAETPTAIEALMRLYQTVINKRTSTANEEKMYDWAGSAVLTKAGLSDDDVTFTKEKFGGP